jgi:condensin-2 complex subunit D3
MIRRHALMILSQLLQEDYLKWKGSMFFRYLSALVDEDESVRKFADSSLTALLLVKAPEKFQAHFVETIFFLNGNQFVFLFDCYIVNYKLLCGMS